MMLLFAALLAVRVPVAFAMIGSSLLYAWRTGLPDAVLPQRLLGGMQPFPLLAIPFFVLVGVVMASGGIASRILGFADTLIGHKRGGLAQVNVFNSLLLGGMSGSGNADAALDAKILVPVMVRHGYDRSFATALSAVTGVISPIIPPGIGLIIYGYLAGVSIGDLFLAGIGPGLLIAAVLSAIVWQLSRRRGYGAQRNVRARPAEVVTAARRSFFALLMPLLLVIGLRLGAFTPTELGAIAALYAIVVSFVVYRELSWRQVPSVLHDAVVTTATVMSIIAAGTMFGHVLTVERIPQTLVEKLLDISDRPVVLLLLVNLLLLVLGTLMDGTALLVIVTPLLAPVARLIGIDPVQFGIVVVFNLTIGAVTPPIGSIFFTATAITKTSLEAYTKAVWPFLLGLVGVLLAVTFVPAISLTIPNVFGG